MAQKGLAFAAITLTTLDKEITRTLEPRDPPPLLIPILKSSAFSTPRRTSLPSLFERPKGIVAALEGMAQAGQCDLLYFDESEFSSNSPLQFGRTVDGSRPSLM